MQRPLWASTSTKNAAYPDTLYVDTLIGPHTVNTLPEATLEAFVDHGALQCGFCTPGLVMATKALLDRNPHPTDDEVRKALERNLCRCAAYSKILEAVRQAGEPVCEHGDGLLVRFGEPQAPEVAR